MKRLSPPKQTAGRSRRQPYGIAILCVVHVIGWLCGLTSAFAAAPAPGPLAWWTFDSAEEGLVFDRAADRKDRVEGNYKLIGGPVGKALLLDGFTTAIDRPAATAPRLNGDFSVEAWVAQGAYPWNWAPIVQQGDNAGYFLGIDSHGYPGFNVQVDGVWEQLTVPNSPPYTDANHLALFTWYQIAGTYDQTTGAMRLLINGREIATKTVGKGGVQTAAADVRVGKAGILTKPTEGVNTNLDSEFGLDGLIDEVRVYPQALSNEQVARSFATFNPGETVVRAPDMQARTLPNPSISGAFKAQYTRFPYYETWENMFRFGPYPDVMVGFDQSPNKFIFWRGLNMVNVMVNESNQWFTNEFCETGYTDEAPGDNEPMSDKGCWDSHARIIESNQARVVVHWRYRLTEPGHHWANYDSNGWGDIADEYYYIYPDGVASKSQCYYSSQPNAWQEWNEQIIILGEGQHPESVVKRSPVMTLVTPFGKAKTYDWNPNPPNPNYWHQMIQMIHFTGKYSPFSIQHFEDGDVYNGERTWYSVFPSWNHWPTAQINSSGRNSTFPDRAAHCSISHLIWSPYLKVHGKIPFTEKLLLQGMTDQPALSLVPLAKSWLRPPLVAKVSGGTSHEYAMPRRAYPFTIETGKPLSFELSASKNRPINNVCLELKNWGAKSSQAKVNLNGKPLAPGTDFRQGLTVDTDGTNTLIVWIVMSADTPQTFEITRSAP